MSKQPFTSEDATVSLMSRGAPMTLGQLGSAIIRCVVAVIQEALKVHILHRYLPYRSQAYYIH